MTLVQIRQFREIDRWIPSQHVRSAYGHDTVSLDEVLLPREEEVVLSDGLGDWKPITIHFDGSVEPRPRDRGFQGKMFAAFPGDLVFSKIDARNGAIGIIPDTLPKVVLTGEYPVHRAVSGRVSAAYLALLLRTDAFQALLREAATGTSGRKRVSADAFRAIEVPLPQLPDQQRLVEQYEANVAIADDRSGAATRLLQEAERGLEKELGLVTPPERVGQTTLIGRLSALSRWSFESVAHGAQAPASDDSHVPLGELVNDLVNGWSPLCEDRPAREGEWGVLKLGAVSFGVYDDRENKALPASLSPVVELAVEEGDVLISRANVTRLVGACAYVERTRPKLMLNDKIFRVVFPRRSRIQPRFLAEVMKTRYLRSQIESQVTGTSPTMKNITKAALLDLLIPLPEWDEQTRLADAMARVRLRTADLRREAANHRQAARDQFQTALFG